MTTTPIDIEVESASGGAGMSAHDDAQDWPITAGRVHPARQYLRDLPSGLREIRIHLHELAGDVAEILWPFMWRNQAREEAERHGTAMFYQGQRIEAERRDGLRAVPQERT